MTDSLNHFSLAVGQPPSAKTLEDRELSVRLKYGMHTIFIIAMADWSFSRLTAELLSILRDRYPNGLNTSTNPAESQITPVPANDGDVKVAYALPKNPNDLNQGWRAIKATETDTIGKKGLTDMCSVAFTFLEPGADDASARFVVEVPIIEEEEE
ncbi:hypothetical protein VTH06DRAFT_2400 [Thermothelomyces fergusii]